jgi:hypothetical protein
MVLYVSPLFKYFLLRLTFAISVGGCCSGVYGPFSMYVIPRSLFISLCADSYMKTCTVSSVHVYFLLPPIRETVVKSLYIICLAGS